MQDHPVRRPMPVEQSIPWTPLQDTHHVTASLQPAEGGRRKIFVRQRVLSRIGGIARTHGRHALGLLMGQLYQCSITGSNYLVIESLAEQSPVADDADLGIVVANVLADVSKKGHGEQAEHGSQILGWYCGATSVEAKPSPRITQVKSSLFSEPWQTTLIIGEAAHGSNAVFVLLDAENSRWFDAAFYELLAHAVAPTQPKPTLVNWARYVTTEPVLRVMRDPKPTASEAPDKGSLNSARPVSPLAGQKDVRLAPASNVASTSARRAVEPAPRDAPQRRDRPTDRPVQSNAATPRSAGFAARRSERKLSIVDDLDQRLAAPTHTRPLSESDDTTLGDDPARFIELARAEGFFIAAKFDTASQSSVAETLWILNEPYSGMLMAVVTSDSDVVDATLHYNLQTDEAGLRRVPFPEHRNLESSTIYMRETCVDSLRARCRRLRATNALVREWKVTPKITLLTPAEWDSIPASGNGADRRDHVSELNNARIAELPAGVRSQFRIVVDTSASA